MVGTVWWFFVRFYGKNEYMQSCPNAWMSSERAYICARGLHDGECLRTPDTLLAGVILRAVGEEPGKNSFEISL